MLGAQLGQHAGQLRLQIGFAGDELRPRKRGFGVSRIFRYIVLQLV